MSLVWPESKGFEPLNQGALLVVNENRIFSTICKFLKGRPVITVSYQPHIFLDTSTAIEKPPRHAGRILPNGFPMCIIQSENITSTSTLAVRTLLPPTVGSIKIVRSTYRSVKWYWERHVRVVKKNIRILILKNNKQRWKIKLHVL